MYIYDLMLGSRMFYDRFAAVGSECSYGQMGDGVIFHIFLGRLPSPPSSARRFWLVPEISICLRNVIVLVCDDRFSRVKKGQICLLCFPDKETRMGLGYIYILEFRGVHRPRC